VQRDTRQARPLPPAPPPHTHTLQSASESLDLINAARPARFARTLTEAPPESYPPAEGASAPPAPAAPANASLVLPSHLSASCSTSEGAPCPVTLTLQAAFYPSPDVLTNIFPAQLLQVGGPPSACRRGSPACFPPRQPACLQQPCCSRCAQGGRPRQTFAPPPPATAPHHHRQVASVTNVTAITGVLSFSVPDWPAASVGLCDSTTAITGACDMHILLPAPDYQLTRRTVSCPAPPPPPHLAPAPALQRAPAMPRSLMGRPQHAQVALQPARRLCGNQQPLQLWPARAWAWGCVLCRPTSAQPRPEALPAPPLPPQVCMRVQDGELVGFPRHPSVAFLGGGHA
jgi:hypothetical protein